VLSLRITVWGIPGPLRMWPLWHDRSGYRLSADELKLCGWLNLLTKRRDGDEPNKSLEGPAPFFSLYPFVFDLPSIYREQLQNLYPIADKTSTAVVQRERGPTCLIQTLVQLVNLISVLDQKTSKTGHTVVTCQT